MCALCTAHTLEHPCAPRSMEISVFCWSRTSSSVLMDWDVTVQEDLRSVEEILQRADGILTVRRRKPPVQPSYQENNLWFKVALLPWPQEGRPWTKSI